MGVVISVLVLNAFVLSVDIGVLVYNRILAVDMGALGVDMVNLRRRRNEEGERAREGEVSRVGRLGGG